MTDRVSSASERTFSVTDRVSSANEGSSSVNKLKQTSELIEGTSSLNWTEL